MAQTGADLRKACRIVHRWLGLGLGSLFILLGLTGSLNVYYREIDAALNPVLFTRDPVTSGVAENIGPEAALRAAYEADPAPVSVLYPPDEVWPVWVINHAHPEGKIFTTTIDPLTSRVLGRREVTRAFAHVVYRLHYSLLLKEWWGEELIGAIGLALLVLAMTGLIVWWPALGRVLRALFPRRGTSTQRLLLDLHRSVGAWATSILVIIAATGVGIVYPSLARSVVGVITTTSPLQTAPRVLPAVAEAPRLSADAILAKALTARPRDVVIAMNPPGPSRAAWRVLTRPGSASPAMRSLSQIWLDPPSGTIVAERNWDTLSNGDRYIALQLSIHNGSIAGTGGRMIIFATGFVPLFLFSTGLLVWLDRQRRRKHR